MDINSLVTKELNKTSLINTFIKGMNTDTSDILLSDDQYRFAKNLRITTNKDNNTGELRLIEGTKPCLFKIDASTAIGQIKGAKEIIALKSIGKYIVIVTDNVLSNGNPSWSVYRYEGGTEEPKLVFGPCVGSVGRDLSITFKKDAEDNITMYMADGIHPLLHIDITSDIKYIKQHGSDSGWTPSTNIQDIYNYNTFHISQPQVTIVSGGTLRSAKVQYAYQVYQKNGVMSSVSPLSKIKILHTEKQYAASTTTVGYNKEAITDCGALITIDTTDYPQSYNKLILYRITYEVNKQQPTVEIVYDGYINRTSTTMTIEDMGRASLKTLSPEELNITGISYYIPKAIEQKDNYLFAANVNTDEFLYAKDWDARAYRYDSNGNTVQDFGDGELNENSTYKYLTDGHTLGGQGTNVRWQFVTEATYPDTYADNYACVGYSNADNRSLKRGEVYRYGIILYSNDGRKSAVKYIGDVYVPYNIKIMGGTDNLLKCNKIGIKFTIMNLPNDCYGYEIVRCERTIEDTSTIAQGAISYTAERYYNSGEDNVLTPAPLLITQPFDVGKLETVGGTKTIYLILHSNKRVCLFISPEVTYQKDDILEALGNNQCYVRIVDMLESPNYRATGENDYYYIPYISTNTGGDADQDRYDSNKKIYAYSIDVNGTYPFTNSIDNTIQSGTNLSVQRYIFGGGNYGASESAIKNDSTRPFFVQTSNGTNRVTMYNGIGIWNTRINQLGGILLNTDRNTFKFAVNDHMSYIKYTEAITGATVGTTYSINRFADATTIKLNDVLSGADSSAQLIVYDKVNTIGDKKFLNFQTGGWGRDGSTNSIAFADATGASFDDLDNKQGLSSAIPDGPGGTCILLLFNEDFETNPGSSYINKLPLCIVDIKKNVSPYGGYNKSAVDTSVFASTGLFFLKNGSLPQVVDVYDGDVYLNPFEYIHLRKWHHPYYKRSAKTTVIYAFPVESRINIAVAKNRPVDILAKRMTWMSYVQEEPTEINDSVYDIHYTQDEPTYVYNTAYSLDENAYINSIMNEDQLENSSNAYRIIYSQLREIGEQTDSWLIFKPASYIDVDTRFGEITNLKTFKNTLFFWLEDATGVLSVNEKQILQNTNNTQLVLGTGGVLQRYDYITNIYGMEAGLFCATQSDSILYWWDKKRKELLAYSGGQIQPLVKTANVSNIVYNKTFLNNTYKDDILYDRKNTEVLVNNNIGIPIYNDYVKLFVSTYDVIYDHSTSIGDTIYLSSGTKLFTWNTKRDYSSKSHNTTDDVYMKPFVRFIVNKNYYVTKVFDTMMIGGKFLSSANGNVDVNIDCSTPLYQRGKIYNGKGITDREYDYRVDVPRAGKTVNGEWKVGEYGDRLRGKTMQCELSSDISSIDFSLQYVTTKYRISWT